MKIIKFPNKRTVKIGAGNYGTDIPACLGDSDSLLINFDKACEGIPFENLNYEHKKAIGYFLMMVGIGLSKVDGDC